MPRSFSLYRPMAFMLLAGLLAGCDFAAEQVEPPAIAVQVITAASQDFPLVIDLVGSTLGNQDVPIRARVDGFLETINFIEGQEVKEGQLLYTIDPQPFQQKVVEAQSQLAAAETSLAKNASDLRRIRPLAEMKAVSEQDLDSAVANEAAARAGVRAAQAGVELANIELGYTKIYAPISGLMGLTKAKPGEYVGKEPNPVVLNVLSDIDPIRVRFSISEREYLILARGFAADKKTAAGYKGKSSAEEEVTDSQAAQQKTPLTLILADGSEWDELGYADATGQAIDPTTGTFQIEAVFPNSLGLLRPGQFARVRAPYKTLKDVVVIPKQAVVELQGIFQVYVVDSNNTVQIVNVARGPSRGSNVVIESGLQVGQSVIVEGVQKVRAGMTVAPQPFQAAFPDSNPEI
jgi:membrane fusion protein (multidrug efflux system)